MNSETHFVTPTRARKSQAKKPQMGELRIIGGKWKRTPLKFPLLEGVRPTPARIRETLFNWLAAEITNSHCLDLFAGSGALGLEALSRGAETVIMVDQSKEVCRALTVHTQKLAAQGATIIQSNALQPALLSIQQPLDIVFCDPPFNQGLLAKLVSEIEQLTLSDKALIYIESERQLTELECPASWQLLKEKTAGDVRYRLYQRQS